MEGNGAVSTSRGAREDPKETYEKHVRHLKGVSLGSHEDQHRSPKRRKTLHYAAASSAASAASTAGRTALEKSRRLTHNITLASPDGGDMAELQVDGMPLALEPAIRTLRNVLGDEGFPLDTIDSYGFGLASLRSDKALLAALQRIIELENYDLEIDAPQLLAYFGKAFLPARQLLRADAEAQYKKMGELPEDADPLVYLATDSKPLDMPDPSIWQEMACPVCCRLVCTTHKLPWPRRPPAFVPSQARREQSTVKQQYKASTRRGPPPKPEEPCSDHCTVAPPTLHFKLNEQKLVRDLRGNKVLMGMIKRFFARQDVAICQIARTIEDIKSPSPVKDCSSSYDDWTDDWRVEAKLAAMKDDAGETSSSDGEEGSSASKPQAQYLPLKRRRKGPLPTDKSFSYRPCRCDGNCDDLHDYSTCLCVLRGTPCTELCACESRCPRQFRGCNCAEGTLECCNPITNERHCVCKVAGRECDPVHCACSASCMNKNMSKSIFERIESERPLKVAESLVCEGKGLFYVAPKLAGVGQYLCEYMGEVIDEMETSLREAEALELNQASYIYVLTKDRCIDAARVGGVARFINESGLGNEKRRKTDQDVTTDNVVARIVQVKGVARIGIYARMKIKTGHELLLNYGQLYAEMRKMYKSAAALPVASGLSAQPTLSTLASSPV